MFTAECIGGATPQAEICDEQDNDCDGMVDDGVLRTYYTDSDGDGFGATGGATVQACSPPSGFAVNDTDCNDVTTGINPLAAEACNGVDDDCDMASDEGVRSTFYRDMDGDSFGTLLDTVEACIRPTGYVTNSIDCDDATQSTNPAAPETCDGVDNNCNEMTDEGGCSCLNGSVRDTGECEIGTQRCSSGARGACTGAVAPRAEFCNTLDDNCNGMTDEGVQNTYYRDMDGDGFGDLSMTSAACSPPPGFVGNSGDCNDGAASISPAATETCDGADNNCDMVTDPGCMCTDGSQRACGGSNGMGGEVGECVAGSQTCSGGVWTGCAGSVGPRTESCNQLDDNCNGSTDEALTIVCYADPDDDGYAAMGAAMETFCPTAGRSEVMGCPIFWTFRAPGTDDCADDDPNRFPGQTEFCNDIDDDCDGTTDEGTNAGCAVPNAYGACLAGACAIVGCAPGFGDCDGARANGCEVDTTSDSAHCTGCGRSCGGGACDSGLCELPTGIGGGGSHACVTFASGGAACWGWNGFQQLGDGTTISRPRPGAVLDVTDAVSIYSGMGGSHSCALTSTGTVQCWGFNTYGQLGNGTNVTGSATAVSGISTATEIATGSAHSCARLSDGTMRCWGQNNEGRLGDGSSTNRFTPVTVSGLSGVTEIGVGGDHSCARTSGTIRCWGENERGQLGDGTTTDRTTPVLVSGITNASGDIRGGLDHTCAIRGSGTVSCWGAGSLGRLGNGGNVQNVNPVNVSGITDAVALATGIQHTCALRAGGTVRCWGNNSNGQLGDGSGSSSSSTPVPVRVSPGLDLDGVTAIAGFGSSTCALRNDGGVYCWGDNALGQLGDGTTTGRDFPTRIGDFGAIFDVSSEGDSNCARRGTGDLLCWGRNTHGQLGDGTTTGRGTPELVTGAQDFVAISAARLEGSDFRGHACGIRGDGTAACWGDNFWGQVGDGTNTNRLVPTTVSGLVDAVQIDAGGVNSCAVRATGQVQCWGFGDGTGRTGGALNTPGDVIGLADGVHVQVGGGPFACALRRSGQVSCWGRNSSGQLGDGTTNISATPVDVLGLNDAIGLTVGEEHACAIRADRTLVCWGRNGSGQLGTGNTGPRIVPTPVVGLDQVTEVRAGEDHTCARRITGQLFCWGANGSRQLGDGTSANRPAPISVGGLGFVDSVSLGGHHTCVRESTGDVRCIGGNTYSQIFDDPMMEPSVGVYQTILGL